MDRNLIDYLPPVMKTYQEIKAVMHTEQPEFELAWDAADAVMRNLFVGDADEYGIQRWEGILSIPAKASDSLEARRARVLIRLNEYLPYTKRALERMLEAICGSDNYSFEVDDKKNFGISVKSESASINTEVLSMLNRILPADLTMGIIANSQAGIYFGTFSAQHIEYENSALEHTYNISHETVTTVGFSAKPTQEIIIETPPRAEKEITVENDVPIFVGQSTAYELVYES